MNKSGLPHNHNCNDGVEKLQEQLSKLSNFQIMADIFKILGDSSRIRIFWLLCHTEECVINISSLVDMTSPAVSHHLNKLKSSGLIVARRDGKEVYYKVANTEKAHFLHLAIERIMEISCPHKHTTSETEQIETIKAIHDYLTQNIEKRITIEDLSKKFLMNTTTLKSAFKTVYGTSVASHIKEHRMEKAAELLKSTNKSVFEIAKMVGYDNSSKFASAFKEIYTLLPTDYRKNEK